MIAYIELVLFTKLSIGNHGFVKYDFQVSLVIKPKEISIECHLVTC